MTVLSTEEQSYIILLQTFLGKVMLRITIASILLLASGTVSAVIFSIDLIRDSGDRKASAIGQSQTFNADASGIRFRIGTSSVDKNRFEFSFTSYNVDDDGEFGQSNEWDLGADYILTFNSQPVIPFIKFGLGIGLAETDMQFTTSSGDTTDNIGNVNGNIGAGLTYKFNNSLSVTGSASYVVRKWQSIEIIDFGAPITLETRDNIIRFGVGLDYSF